MSKAASSPAKDSPLTRPQPKKNEGSTPATSEKSAGEAVVRLLATANSFLRLGLVGQAIDHLAQALRSDPSLHLLREPLMKLYVSQRQDKEAIAELWTIISLCDDPQEEIRFLRYILRLDPTDQAAAQRLKAVLSPYITEPAEAADGTGKPSLLVSSIVEELRRYLDGHRPLSDFAATVNLHEAETRHPFTDSPQSLLATRPSTPEAEELAEEMALSSSNLKEQLRELDDCLSRRLYSEAQRRLWALREQYPHSKNVRARLQQLEQAQAEQTAELQPVVAAPAAETVAAPHIHSAPTLPLAARPAAASPPPPNASGKKRREQSLSDAESALRSGAMLWNSGRLMQAIALFEKAREDDTCGTMAALMAGLCYREIDRPKDAIATFMRAINRPEADDKDLSWLFYELGATHEMIKNVGEAILFYQMSLGADGSFRDAKERIAALQASLLST